MACRRPVKRVLFWGVAVSLILAAVLVGLIQLALPWWASDADRVARLLSSRLETPVTIQEALPAWNPRGPVIELRGVRFGATGDSQGAAIEHATWAIDFSGLVRSSRRFSEFRLHGVDITLAKAADGRWDILGLPDLLRREPTRSLGEALRALPAFALRDSRLTVRYAPDRPAITMALPELRRIGGDGATRWRGRVRPTADAADKSGDMILALDIAENGSGHAYVGGKSLALASWLGELDLLAAVPTDGELDVKAWLSFDADGVSDAQFDVAQGPSVWLDPVGQGDKDADGPIAETSGIHMPALSFDGRWQRGSDASFLVIEGLASAHRPPAHLRGQSVDGRMHLRAEAVDLQPLASIATLIRATPEPVRRWLLAAQPRGRIDALDIVIDSDGFRQASLRVGELVIPAANGAPGITGLTTRIRADRNGVVLWPEGRGVVVDYPGVFAAPVSFDATGGAIAAWRDEGIWSLAMDRLAVEGPDFHVTLAGGISLPSDQPIQLDLGARVDDTAVEAVKPFWPINKMRNSSGWLNRSLKGGRIVHGNFWLRGPANAFPFKDNSGRLDAVAHVVDAGLDYHREWPELTDVVADVAFENGGMRIIGETLRVAGIRVEGGRAEVPDLKMPILRVDAKTRGTGEQLFAFVDRSPLKARYGRHLEGMRIDGSPRAVIALTLPLKRELGQAVVDSRLIFAGERFTDEQRDLDLGDLDGELVFTRHGVSARAMKLTMAGEPAVLDLRIGDAVLDTAAVLEAQLAGRLSASALFGRIDTLGPVIAAANGQADWRVDVFVPDNDTAGIGVPATPPERKDGWVRVESDLAGIELTLPAPLAKDRNTLLPLRLHVDTAPVDRGIDLQLGQLLRLDARLASPGRPFAGAIALGGASPERRPEQGLVVTGQVPALDLGGWLALDDKDTSVPDAGAVIAWPRVILRAGELGVLGRGFRDVDLQMQPGTEGVDVRLAGPDIEGTIFWTNAAAGRVVRGRFARVHVPAGSSTGLGDSLAPSAIPALDIEAEDLRVGGNRLGRTRLIAHPRDGAYHIDTFESRSAAFELDATGDWRRRDGQDESDLDIQLRADDLGKMLESFGFAGLIEGGRTKATIDGRWAGSPAAFALERIDGTLDIDVEAGRILDVDPGVGRLFGLLNLREIPRRMILDFRDIFSQGMRFNSIKGRFALNVGEAYTDDMMLKSPSADILITGRTGLIMRDYDQTLEVSPRMAGTLPVVGAIAGGPAGAAAGLVVQGLLGIDKAAKIIYRVTGPWDEPVIIKEEPGASVSRRDRSDAVSMEPST